MPDKIKLTDEIVDRVVELAETGRDRNLSALLVRISDADVALLISVLKPEEKVIVFRLLEPETAGEVLDDVDPVSLKEIMHQVNSEMLAHILETMPTDEAADAIGEAEDEEQMELLDLMEDKEAQGVRAILKYPEDSAGGIMSPHFLSVNENMTTDQAIHHIRRSEIKDDIFYLYVVDNGGVLVGVVPLQALLTSKPESRIRSIMNTEVHTVDVDADQEQVARVSIKYDLVAVPVVDRRGVLVGRILYDDIVDVVEEEATEDIYKLAGTTNEELYSNSSLKIARLRLPWLFITIFGSLTSGLIIYHFTGTIKEAIALASFIPVITATGGNSGLQSVTVAVRGLATGQLSSHVIGRTILREVRTALIIAIVIGVPMGVIANFWVPTVNAWLGFTVGCSMFLAITMTTILGFLIPLFFRAIKIDPALASGPLVTTLNDIIGLLIYLSLAWAFLAHL